MLALAAALGLTSALWAAAQSSDGQNTYYRANEIGIPFEEISPAAAADHRFVLVHRRAAGDAGGSERLLLEDGRQVRRWVTRRDARGERLSESDYVGGELVAERSFDASGRLAGSATYADGALLTRTAYTYEPRLVRVEAVGPEGAVQFRATYELAATGQLRDFVRIAPGQDQTGARFVFAGGALIEEILTTGSTRLVSRYLAGERYQVEEWRGDRLHVVRETQRSPDGVLIAETVFEPARDRRTTRRFDAAGRELEVLTTEQGRQMEIARHARDAAGRIVTTTRESADGDERWDYEYAEDVLSAGASGEGPDDRLRSARHQQGGLLVSVTTYDLDAAEGADDAPSTWQIDFYRDGVPFRRERYRGEVRTHEQILRDGQVIRERVLDAGAGANR